MIFSIPLISLLLLFFVSPVVIPFFVIIHLVSKLWPRQSENYIVDKSVVSKFKVVGRIPNVPLKDVSTLVSEMRDSFNAGLTRPMATRIAQLKKLLALMVENESAIFSAINADFKRPEWDTLAFDVLSVINDIKHLIANCESYSQPRSAGFCLFTFPGAGAKYPEPYGVTLILDSWNLPFQLGFVPIAGAIAAGNAIVFKPCTIASNCSRLMARLIQQYMDPWFVSVVGAEMEGNREMTSSLLENKFDLIFFTGSPSVGKIVMEGAAKFLTPTVLELGGKNPVLIDATADIDIAAKRTVWTRYLNAGQMCISPDYVLVDRIVGRKQFDRIQKMIKDSEGKLIVGGEAFIVDASDLYISPTVMEIEIEAKSIQEGEETYGPVLLVFRESNNLY